MIYVNDFLGEDGGEVAASLFEKNKAFIAFHAERKKGGKVGAKHVYSASPASGCGDNDAMGEAGETCFAPTCPVKKIEAAGVTRPTSAHLLYFSSLAISSKGLSPFLFVQASSLPKVKLYFAALFHCHY